MSQTKKTLSSAAALSLVASALLISSPEVFAGKTGMEKCTGIAKAGMNDCGANGHDCSGKSTVSGDASEWVYVPTGSCEKIVGGSIKS